MGDAAGQLADGLHFLGLLQLSLELFALGDVARHAHPAFHFAVGVANRITPFLDPAAGAVRLQDAVFQAVRHALAEQRLSDLKAALDDMRGERDASMASCSRICL